MENIANENHASSAKFFGSYIRLDSKFPARTSCLYMLHQYLSNVITYITSCASWAASEQILKTTFCNLDCSIVVFIFII